MYYIKFKIKKEDFFNCLKGVEPNTVCVLSPDKDKSDFHFVVVPKNLLDRFMETFARFATEIDFVLENEFKNNMNPFFGDKKYANYNMTGDIDLLPW